MMHVQMKSTSVISKPWLSWVVVLAVSTLAACSSTSDKPAPTALTPLAAQRSVAPIWSAQVGPMGTTLSMNTTPGRLALVSQNGLVSVINAENGSLAWQLPLNTPISAGIGGDGQRYAVVTQANELITLSEGKVLWRSKLPTNAFTTPLVAGGRVFALTTDRTVLAFDGASGQRL
jgi:outer membrane protein assembly factor BamB